jgi:hypothetical protein
LAHFELEHASADMGRWVTMQHRNVDWVRVAQWTEHVAKEDLAPIRSVFHAHGASGPVVTWTPSISQIETPELRLILAYWSRAAQGSRLPRWSDIDLAEIGHVAGYVILLDVVEEGQDFEYRIFGNIIAEVSEFDMTGKRLSMHKASAYIVEFSLAVYRAALIRHQPVLTEHRPTGTKYTAAWQRVVLPLVDASGTVIRILIGTVPVDRDGKVIARGL